jgi:hypothetical protein
MEYTVIEGTSTLNLEHQVNLHIQKGWIPQGGIYSIHIDRKYDEIYKYYQAMIKVK